MKTRYQSLFVCTLLCSLLSLAACGQRGPLYLPEEANDSRAASQQESGVTDKESEEDADEGETAGG
mgnify:CR=1 FL=1